MSPKSHDPVNETVMSDIRFSLQHTETGMTTAVMPNFWSDAKSALFVILEEQVRSRRINNLGQWLPEDVAISVSDVLLGPMSDAP